MHPIDWSLLIAPIVFQIVIAIYAARYIRSVADFLAGGRCAGRYLLANARGESDSGLANTMSKFEQILVAGFVLNFWEKISMPVLLLIGITGFVVYRFRETRALTLAQFLEARYSRNFRLFMGTLAFLSGILNYGIFPAISARFFIYFLRLPATIDLGPFEVSTFAAIMFGYLAVAVFVILAGGHVTAMVTDCIEGIVSHAIYIVIIIAVFFIVSWSQIVQVMSQSPPGHSQINPFDAESVKDFNVWFILMQMFLAVYGTMALQNKQAFNSAARSAHESRMAHVLGSWRTYARLLMILLLGVCAITYMKHPDFAQVAAPVKQTIDQVPSGYLQKQMTVPVALSYLLPIGIKGLFVSMMVMGLLAGDTGHIHSWGSIFVQDVVMPLRKKPLTPRQHLWLLRLAVLGVAGFAFVFSLLWTQVEYITFWWAITSGVFTAGAGAAIIGGLYWKKGTTPAAWAGTLTGSSLCLIGILCGKFWADIVPWIAAVVDPLGVTLPQRFWLTNMQSAFFATLFAATVYIVVALLTSRHDYNLQKLLHRGAYRVEGEDRVPLLSMRERFRVRNILKFDANFTFWDKLVSGGIFWWAIFLLAINLVISVWNLAFFQWPVSWWAHYWMITAIAFPFLIGLVTLVWFSVGGVIDIRDFFRALSARQRDARDDGRVEHGEIPSAIASTAAPAGQVSSIVVDPSSQPRKVVSTAAATGR
jgi:SSS family solute:Na+ symporter